jgi:UDP-N-acetylmuramoyl-L-alanyl-D-glutamate--2,6-diaminopimelate ligase
MLLGELLSWVPEARVQGHVSGRVVRGVTNDSRAVRRGSVFVCFRGARHDGHAFVPQAVRGGAVAIVSGFPLKSTVPVVVVRDPLAALARLSAAFWGFPSRRLDVVGITGTNGKTTSVFMAESILASARIPAGIIGTIRNSFRGREYRHVHTTPEAHDLQQMMADMLERGARAVVMEVSSHSLDMKRVEGTSFRAGVFTNLTRDHLDYHRSMAKYFEAKSLLFSSLPASAEGGVAVLNWDSPEGRRLAGRTRARVMPFSAAGRMAGKIRGGLRATDVRASAVGTQFVLHEDGQKVRVSLHMPGAHNVANALAAAGAARSLGVGLGDIARGLGRLKAVPGRMEKVHIRAPFTVVVDYAHTPDALERVLASLRPLARRRLAVVFGCGGNRDATKRPIMGRIAAERADFSWITSDNPRYEEPDAIISGITAGIRRPGRYAVVADRRKAIRSALSAARAGDIVLLAGKGHEMTQDIAGRSFQFHDTSVAREEWARISGSASGARA